MYVIKQATSLPWMIFCHDSNGDAVTGLLDGDFTKRISKNGGAFADMTVTITEVEAGFYGMTLSTSHTDTNGILTLYFTNASCEQVNCQFRVETRLLDNLAFPTTSGRSFDCNSDGTVDPNLSNATGALAKGTTITGFNDLSSTAVAAAVALYAPSLALADYDPPTKAEMDTAVAAQAPSTALALYDPPTNAEMVAAVAAQAPSTALALYDPPTKAEMDAGFLALNDIAVADILAQAVDGTLTVEDAQKALIAYTRGRVVKASTAFTYYSQTSVALWVNNISATDRNIL